MKQYRPDSTGLILGILLLLALPGLVFGQSLKKMDGVLYYQHGNKSTIVQKLEADSDFYGFDLMDKTHVFIAYQRQDTAEAVAVLAIYDVETGKETYLDEFGGVGESHFVYNRENGLVLFNWSDGIYTLKIKGPIARYLAKPKLILKEPEDVDFFTVSWVDARKFSYEEFNQKTRQSTIKYHTLPE